VSRWHELMGAVVTRLAFRSGTAGGRVPSTACTRRADTAHMCWEQLAPWDFGLFALIFPGGESAQLWNIISFFGYGTEDRFLAHIWVKCSSVRGRSCAHLFRHIVCTALAMVLYHKCSSVAILGGPLMKQRSQATGITDSERAGERRSASPGPSFREPIAPQAPQILWPVNTTY